MPRLYDYTLELCIVLSLSAAVLTLGESEGGEMGSLFDRQLLSAV